MFGSIRRFISRGIIGNREKKLMNIGEIIHTFIMWIKIFLVRID